MNIYLTAYFVSAVVMLIIDGIWLSLMAKPFYGKYLGHIMADTPHLPSAAIFYIIYILGLTVLVIEPAISEGSSYLKVFLFGALFGLAAYSTYDLTNQATLKNWPVIVTVVDLVWGTLLTGTVALATTIIVKLIYG